MLDDKTGTPPWGAIGYSEGTHTVHVLLLNSNSLLVLQILAFWGSLALSPRSIPVEATGIQALHGD